MAADQDSYNKPVIQRFPDRKFARDEDMLCRGLERMPYVMQQLGFDKLRKGQEQAVVEILCGRDTVCVLPTSAGKSAVVIVPTLALNMRTVFFVPLVALMRDQMTKMNKWRVNAAQMSGLQSDGQNMLAAKQWAIGQLNMLYVAPERLRNPAFIAAMDAVPPDIVAVDEAHVISSWSDSFRPDYCHIGDFIRDRKPKIVVAITATLGAREEEDVRRVLCMNDAAKVTYYFRRSNLHLRSRPMRDLDEVLDYAADSGEKGCTLVYCATIKNAEQFASLLQNTTKLPVGLYHGELADSAKREALDGFMEDRIKVMAATKAFGMGIDKPNIRAVIHRDIPDSPDSYAQETGRGGRDGAPTDCMAFLDAKSVNTQRYFIMCANPDESDVRRVYDAMKRMADPKTGMLLATHKDVGEHAGVNPGVVYACVDTMRAANVITAKRASGQFGMLRFTGMMEDDTFKRFRAAIAGAGREVDDGVYEVRSEKIADEMGVKTSTVQGYIRKYREAQLLDWTPPFLGSEMQVIGDVNLVEFDRLAEKQQRSYAKLDAMVSLMNTPDERKHEFLEAYLKLVP